MILYSILPISLLDSIKFGTNPDSGEIYEVYQNNKDSVRINKDGTEFLVSYPSDNQPSVVNGYPQYDVPSMLNITNNLSDGWVIED